MSDFITFFPKFTQSLSLRAVFLLERCFASFSQQFPPDTPVKSDEVPLFFALFGLLPLPLNSSFAMARHCEKGPPRSRSCFDRDPVQLEEPASHCTFLSCGGLLIFFSPPLVPTPPLTHFRPESPSGVFPLCMIFPAMCAFCFFPNLRANWGSGPFNFASPPDALPPTDVVRAPGNILSPTGPPPLSVPLVPRCPLSDPYGGWVVRRSASPKPVAGLFFF